jgi:protein-S-isoprenylcysteine O-methyltransferase Ste14
MPPVYLLGAIVAMVALHFLFPIGQIVSGPWRWIGLAPAAVGLAIGGSAASLFRKRKTTIKPGDVSTSLMTDGPFRFSRNPIYVGMVCLLAGVAIGLGTISPWLVIPFFVAAISLRIIPVEEAMLHEAFGESYREYQLRVRRWI